MLWSAATAADRPRADARRVQHVLGPPNLLLAARAVRGARTTVGPPGAGRELQTAGVAVSGADAPVATGLASGDRVPVDAVGPLHRRRSLLRGWCVVGGRRRLRCRRS